MRLCDDILVLWTPAKSNILTWKSAAREKLDAREDLRRLGDARQALVQRVRRQVVEVEVDVILGALQSKNNRSAGGALGISPDTLWFPLPDMKPFDFL